MVSKEKRGEKKQGIGVVKLMVIIEYLIDFLQALAGCSLPLAFPLLTVLLTRCYRAAENKAKRTLWGFLVVWAFAMSVVLICTIVFIMINGFNFMF